MSEDDQKILPRLVFVKGLYRLDIDIDELKGYKNVHMNIIRWDTDNTPFDPEDYLPKCMSHFDIETTEHILQYIRESFTLEEIKLIRTFLKSYRGSTVGSPTLCSLPIDGSILPTGWIPINKDIDFYMFFKLFGYYLPFDIVGQYDLRNCSRVNKEEDKYGVNQFV